MAWAVQSLAGGAAQGPACCSGLHAFCLTLLLILHAELAPACFRREPDVPVGVCRNVKDAALCDQHGRSVSPTGTD